MPWELLSLENFSRPLVWDDDFFHFLMRKSHRLRDAEWGVLGPHSLWMGVCIEVGVELLTLLRSSISAIQVCIIFASRMLPQLNVSLHITSGVLEPWWNLVQILILVLPGPLRSPRSIHLIELLWLLFCSVINLRFRGLFRRNILWDVSLLHTDFILRVVDQLLIPFFQKLLSQLWVRLLMLERLWGFGIQESLILVHIRRQCGHRLSSRVIVLLVSIQSIFGSGVFDLFSGYESLLEIRFTTSGIRRRFINTCRLRCSLHLEGRRFRVKSLATDALWSCLTLEIWKAWGRLYGLSVWIPVYKWAWLH